MHLPTRQNLAQQVTDLLLAKLESGVKPWKQEWTSIGRPSRPLKHNGEPYTGINTLYLWAVADDRDYTSPYWMTARQAEEFGGNVKTSERSSFSIYFNTMHKSDINPDTGADDGRTIRYMRANRIFNADQIEGLPPYFYCNPANLIAPPPSKHQAAIDAFFNPIPVTIHFGGNKAYYNPTRDFIALPEPAQFHSADHAASTRAHELVHATAAEHRVNRQLGKRFQDNAYCMEELIAEVGSALVCSALGLPDEIHESHASYLDSYIRLLRADKTAIITAAAKAEEAVTWLSQWSLPIRSSSRRQILKAA